MADEQKTQDDTKVEDGSESKKADAKIGIVTWAILAVVVVFFAGSGFLLGRLLADSDKPQTQSSQTDKAYSAENPKMENSSKNSESSWYYDLDPVVANLDEPGVTRYVRTALKLDISSALNQVKGEKLLEQKKPILINWLRIYLASLTLKDARGERNLKRIQSQILDSFNEILFPDAKPQVKHILYNEFVIN